MRSALVVHPSADLYGSDRVAFDTVRSLVERGWRVTVALPVTGPLAKEMEACGAAVELCPSPVLRRQALQPVGFLRLLATTVRSLVPGWRLLRGGEFDVVYVSTVTLPLWIVLARLARRPLVCHSHEAEVSHPWIVRSGLALPLLLATRVIANSRFTLEALLATHPRLRSRSVVILNSVVGPPVVAEARAALDGRTRVLFVGRLSARKGPDVALAALRELAAIGVDAELVLAGSIVPGSEQFEQQLREFIAAHGLDDRVVFEGFCPDVWPLLAVADVVVVPSVKEESFGNVAVEAVIAARPTVVSSLGGLPEAVAGFASSQLVEPGDAHALALAIGRAVDGWTEYRASAASDAEVAVARHALDRYGDQVEGELRSLVPTSARRAA